MEAREHLRVALLGGFVVTAGGREIADQTWRLRKARSLVKLLALAPRHRLPWEQLGETLWPGRDAVAVRNNFHQTLRAARLALASVDLDGREALRLRDGVVSLGEDVTVEVDVEEFTAAAERAAERGGLDAHRVAAALYTGELLPEDRYEDWTHARRKSLRDQHAALLLSLSRLYHDRGQPAAAIDTLRTLIVHDEMHEPARRALMQLLASTGRRQEALAEYEALRDALQRDLEADPDPETRRLYRRLLAGSLEEPSTPDHDDRTGDTAPGPTDNLPVSASSFVGRDRELGEIERLLASSRLLTLTGVGGAGKTRLALEAARRQLGNLDHGVWLVDLAPTSDPSGVPLAVAETLGLEQPERGPALPAVVEQLAPRRLLLVLDNCEHLVTACAEMVAAVLRACPDVTVLATSREALRVEGEVAWRVPSLALPDLHHLPDHPDSAGRPRCSCSANALRPPIRPST